MEQSVGSEKPAARAARISIREEWCKGCQFCVAFCPRDVFRMEGGRCVVERPDLCTCCRLCVWICPEFAIQVSCG
ncbi:MAG: 4Fe-4S binding protein [Planctomycetes bacterium]|nr:4Fe-4S binding protein [Planctomycetota bacterium]